ncbi:uncharacterized protein F5147DRAFT_701272 [Suillus discolor]|uniref:phospholipase D n=1 Tax=Suillus discolor TaxID=1912936 RepID=A0A9P7F5T6_9AGAM|nr:uncharacterized protein F5147DRAFT_701272 [Suillus discolor]KAG2106164.1 hypothetical protein F5147DRAFT_701272 [Suillus discolor]
MSFLDKVLDYAERLPEGIERTRDQIIGIINPDRRHDKPEEKLDDEIRAQINASHRFDSFADQRLDNSIKWHIDGHDYMYALSEILDSAKECIFILDWWLTPELYLRRPPADHPEWRLDRLLQRKARQGVRIYVVVYKEVTQTMSMNSKHTKAALEALHPNIACMRHPDHIGSKDTVEFWSHHEKLVVVDNHRGCVGGLDICFGRWDTHNHPLADVHPTDWSRTLFPGQDYNNARVHMTICGSVCLDLSQHFIERWNEVKRRKVRVQHFKRNIQSYHSLHSRFDWLALPHNVALSPNEAVAIPIVRKWHQMGRRFRTRFHLEQDDEVEPPYTPPPHGACRVQAVRSVCDWSQGVLTEHSIQNAYIQLINEANHFIYIGNISNTREEGPVKNQIAKALVERIIKAAKDDRKFKLPGFAGDVKNDTQYRTMNRGGHSINEEIRKLVLSRKMDYIRFYHLRSYDRINAPQKTQTRGSHSTKPRSLLRGQWEGPRTTTGDAPKEMLFKVPQPAQEGMVLSETKMKPVKKGSDDIRGDEGCIRYRIAAQTAGPNTLSDEIWYGSEAEERDAYVYCCISLGDGDSEIALVVEDGDMRRKLFREHLGLIEPQNVLHSTEKVTSFMRYRDAEDTAVADPLADSTLELWNHTARVNREIFTEVFRPVPTNLVRSWSAYESYLPKVKTGHVVPGIPLQRIKERLSQVRGSLVECPLDFLIDDKEFVEGVDWLGLNPTLPIYI